MLITLAFRNLLVKRGRSLFLLLGYGLGVGVMIVLLSVGAAMLNQSRDVSLVGGGEVTVLPEGIDIEALRTGGVSAMFFTIDRARFVARQGLGGPRHASLVASVSPAIESKLLYLRKGAETMSVRAGGEIPSRAARVGAAISVLEGSWSDSPEDSRYFDPSPQQLYDEIRHSHGLDEILVRSAMVILGCAIGGLILWLGFGRWYTARVAERKASLARSL